MTEPLSTERLAKIRADIALATQGPPRQERYEAWTRAADTHAETLLDEVDRLRAEHDELLTELDGRDEKARKRWIRKQEKQLGIRYADFRTGAWEMDLAMGREMAAAYVAMAKSLLGDGPNYSETKICFDVKIAESPETYTLVVQRHGRGVLTPHEARLRAEEQRDEALAVLQRVREAKRLGEALAAVAEYDGLSTTAAISKEQH